MDNFMKDKGAVAMKNILILLAVVILFLPKVALAVAPDLVFSTDTVYDRANNLTWTKDASTPGPAACLPGITKDWNTATGTYINCLNSNNYLGYNDWRIPTVDELRIFRDNGLLGSTLVSMGISMRLTGDYWTSSVFDTSSAWIVSMFLGSVGSLAKTSNIAVWPVRGPANGACGTSNGANFLVAPTTNICSSGMASAITGTGPWSWTCTGTSGGMTASCTANFGINAYDNVLQLTASQLNGIVVDKALMTTLWFSQSTPWPTQYQTLAQEILEKGKNPGLGVRSLHAQGITGRGVNVAIIDQNLASLNHPEYKGKIVKFNDMSGYPADFMGSLHGPAVTSLLVGETIGTAPDANLYYVALPQALDDAQYEADALDWIIAESAKLPSDQKIRVVSISAAPSGAGSPRTKNNAAWDAAVIRANSAGTLVLDCTSDKGVTDISYFDLDDPDNISKVSLYPGSVANAGHIYIPTSRTQAEEYSSGDYSYLYTGKGGPSWTVPYLAGVLAMGWQLRPELTSSQMMDLVFETAITNATNMKVLNPPVFIDRVKSFSANPPVNGSCGTSNGGTFTIAPTTNLCTTGTASTVSGTGSWSWSCTGSNGGGTENCSASAKASQTISFGTAPSVAVGGTGTVSASATSGLAVSFSSTSTSICTISGSTVTGIAAGTCTIAANQAGNASYNAAAQVTQSITVTAVQATISPDSVSASAGSLAGTISVTAGTGSAWTAVSNASWITITSGSSGSGNGYVVYAVAANTGTSARTGTLTIAGQTFTVTQQKRRRPVR